MTMSGITKTGGSIPPSIQPQVQPQQNVTNPGLNANLISLATPPASFSQGKRFFITENNGSYQLTTENSSDVQSSQNPGGSFVVSGDDYEINASVAYAITTGVLTPGGYMAEVNANNQRLQDVITQVGASPLQSPSLAGDITGDSFDATAILAFLKKNKGQIDDNQTKSEIDDIQGNAAAENLIKDVRTQLSAYDSDEDQIKALQENNSQGQNNAQIQNLQNQAQTALSTAQDELHQLLGNSSSLNATQISASLSKLNQQQQAALLDTVSKAVIQSVSSNIDQHILNGSPLGKAHHHKTLDTNDGTVVKSDDQETQDAIQEQLESADFQNQLAQSIEDNAQSLGLGNLSPADLKNVAQSVASLTATTLANDPQFLQDAVDNTNALQSDVSNILQLEIDGQSGRSNTPNNV
jgi:hypothetical protein